MNEQLPSFQVKAVADRWLGNSKKINLNLNIIRTTRLNCGYFGYNTPTPRPFLTAFFLYLGTCDTEIRKIKSQIAWLDNVREVAKYPKRVYQGLKILKIFFVSLFSRPPCLLYAYILCVQYVRVHNYVRTNYCSSSIMLKVLVQKHGNM